MHESGEMYLETILILSRKNQSVRSIDVAKELGFSKPSVSRAIGILKDDGYIQVDDHGYLKLTEDGFKIANDIYEKHRVLTEFFVEIVGVTPEIAEADACKIEHVISEEAFEGIKKILKARA